MLITVRLLLIYGGATALIIFVFDRWIQPLPGRARIFLAFAPLLITGQAMLAGGVFAPVDISYQYPPFASLKTEFGIGSPKTPNLGDVVMQEIP